MSIREITNSIQLYIPSNPLSGKFSLNLPRVASNLNKIAIPVIAIYAFSNAHTALAGPVSFSACVTGCLMLASPFALPGCLAACLPILAMPTP